MAPVATCGCGACKKCKRRIYMRDYYRRNRETMIATGKASRERNIEAVRERDRARGFRGTPEKTKARNAARVLERQPCEVCGNTPADAHHDDYSKPLQVRWLCKSHHGEAHRLTF